MLKNNKNLFESVICDFDPPEIWRDKTLLSPECRERFLTPTDLPELGAQEFEMAGLSELRDGYEIERVSENVHTLLFTLEGQSHLPQAVGE